MFIFKNIQEWQRTLMRARAVSSNHKWPNCTHVVDSNPFLQSSKGWDPDNREDTPLEKTKLVGAISVLLAWSLATSCADPCPNKLAGRRARSSSSNYLRIQAESNHTFVPFRYARQAQEYAHSGQQRRVCSPRLLTLSPTSPEAIPRSELEGLSLVEQ